MNTHYNVIDPFFLLVTSKMLENQYQCTSQVAMNMNTLLQQNHKIDER